MTPTSWPHVVFSGGGTGGHLFPGLAVAQRLCQIRPKIRITFAGSGKPFEKEHVEAARFDYLAVPSRALPRRLSGVIPFLANNLAGYRMAGNFLDRHQVAVVVGTGGYASAGMARAAIRRGIPLVLLEQNAVPGRATRWLARSAVVVCTAFEEASQHLSPKCPVRVTGNPVRHRFLAVATEESEAAISSRDENELLGTSTACSRSLLILGGSNGARSLNRHVPPALGRIRAELAGWRIVHQSGVAELAATRRLYEQLQVRATVLSHITQMSQILNRSDLVVSRAGGTTLAELATAGLPAILLPYPFAADDHQRRNADVFSANGGCLTLDERDLAGRMEDHLANAISKLVTDEQKRNRMSTSMARLARPNATRDVAALVHHLIQPDESSCDWHMNQAHRPRPVGLADGNSHGPTGRSRWAWSLPKIGWSEVQPR
jgi:UDP-N-acetylglucosamine--N-acetylmuramyl-(pentapeptide) pyrophosphoryl-undecaprenol N-acetylglucosamine transferase